MSFFNMIFVAAISVRNQAGQSGLAGFLTAAEFGIPALIIAIIGAIGTKKAKQTDEDAKFIQIDSELFQKMITMETLKSFAYIIGVIALFVGVIVFVLSQVTARANQLVFGVIVGGVGLVLIILSIVLSVKIKKIRKAFLEKLR